MKVHVIVWKDGSIQIKKGEPEGAISIAEVAGFDVAVEAIKDTATLTEHGYIAPEVREAFENGGDGVKALVLFQERFMRALREVYR